MISKYMIRFCRLKTRIIASKTQTYCTTGLLSEFSRCKPFSSYNEIGFFPASENTHLKSNFPSNHERVITRRGKKLIIRKASLEDYENILSIGAMYGGLDYLPSLYKPLLTSGDAHMFVGSINGETVGFTAMLMIANRTQAVPIAKRCMLQHRNQGIGRALTEASIKYVVENEPKCGSIMRVVSTEHMQHNSKYGLPFTVWAITNTTFSRAQIRKLLTHLEQQNEDSSSIFSITPNEAIKLLDADNRDVFGYRGLFPVTYSCVPYARNDPSLKHILNTCLLVYSQPVILNSSCLKRVHSNVDGMNEYIRYSNDTERGHSDELPGLSMSAIIEIPSGIHFNIYYYGQSCIAVLSQHLQFILSSFIKTHEYKRNTGHVVITINMPMDIPFADVENLFKGFCIHHETEYPHVYECPL